MGIRDKIFNICREKRIPFCVGIEVTNMCNMSCKYCYNSESELYTMPLEIINKTIYTLSQMNTCCLTITGGEPFLRKDISDIFNCVQRHNMMYYVFTNGTIPIDIPDSPNLLRVEITIYGGNEKTYEAFCSYKAGFNNLMKNLETLKRKNTLVLLKFVPTQYNQHDYDEIVRIARYYSCDLSVNTVVFDGNNNCKACMLNDQDLSKMIKHSIELSSARSTLQKQEKSSHLCGAGRYSFVISANGDVKACFVSKDSAGNILNSDLQSLWENSPYFELRRRMNSLNACDKCENIDFCFSCPEMILSDDDAVRHRSSELCRQTLIRKEVST